MLWIADSSGGNPKQLTTEGREFDFNWSPDGTEIAYVSRRTGTGDIWVAPIDGRPRRQLTRDIRDDRAPRWSADGKWIAFISDRGRQTDLWVVPAAGGTESRVTDDAAEEGSPQWVGNRLGYHTGSTGQAVWSLTAGDGAQRQLTPDSIVVGQINPSPDGTELAYEVLRGGGVSDILVMPMGGGTSRTIATGGSINTEPNWSPDGKSVLFLSNRTGSADVWVVPAAGGQPRALSDFAAGESSPQWSADGSSVYFVSRWQAAPFGDVWKVPAAGGAPTRLTKTGAVNGLAVSLVSADVLVQLEGGKEGRTVLARLRPDGKLETLWDRSNFTSFSWLSFTPKADSFAFNAELPSGEDGSYLISLETGQGRQLLGPGDLVGDFSPDGRWLAYWTGTATLELGVIDMTTGSHRQLTKTAESETSYWWTADNNTIVLTRQSQRRRIATVDLSRLGQ
jgi:Tol biopolymer transport system component